GSSDGSIDVTISGSATPSFSWAGPNGFTASTEDISGLEAGTYVLTVSWGSGCSTIQSITLNDPDVISISDISVTDVQCTGPNTGAISITAAGGTGSLSYSIDNGTSYQSASTFTGLAAGSYTVIVKDDNACATTPQSVFVKPTISIGDVTVNETDGSATLQVTISGSVDQNVDFSWSTSDGSALAASDYSAVSTGTGSVNAGNTTTTISVDITDDAINEPQESFNVTISGLTNATVCDNTGIVTIVDDDDVEMSISDVSLSEGNSGVTTFSFTVTLNSQSAQTVSANYSTADNTATAGTDYTAATGIVSFAPGQTTRTIDIDVSGELVYELDETFYVNLSSPTNATIADAQGLGTIENDDNQPEVTLSSDATTIAEDGGVATITATLSNPSASDVTIVLDLGGSAGSGDYSTTSETIVIPAGDTQGTFVITGDDDNIVEADETVVVSIDSVTNGTISGGSQEETVTIIDDDSGVVSITANDSNASETGPDNGQFTVYLNNPSSTATVISYTIGGTAETDGSDYTALTGSVEIPAGSTSATIDVSVIDDSIDELDETVVITLGSITSGDDDITIDGSNNESTVTITDNDTSELSINDVSVDESAGTATFTLTTTLENSQDITVSWITQDDSAISGDDYTAASSTASITAGQTSTTIAVSILEDVLDEIDETFNVNLSSPANAVITDATGVGTILDNDDAPTISLASPSLSIDEDAGTVTVTVNLSAASGQPVYFDYATSDGDAVSGSDYTSTSGTATIPAGITTYDIVIPITDDNIDEINETFNLVLSNPQHTSISGGSTATVTIIDNEPPTAICQDVTIELDGSGSATITASDVDYGSYDALDITYALDITSFDCDDLGSNTVTMTVTDSNGNSSQCQSTVTVEDNIDPVISGCPTDITIPVNTTSCNAIATWTVPTATDNCSVSGFVSTHNSGDAFTVGTTTVTYTATDPAGNETTCSFDVTVTDAVPTLSIDDISVIEGDAGNIAMDFTVSLSVAACATAISVDYTINAVSATEATDYTATSYSGTLNFAAGESSKTISVNAIGDDITEPDETFTIDLSGAVNATIADGQGLGTILNDDSSVISIVATTQASEPGTDGLFTVELTNPVSVATEVTFNVT
ncbi:MAG: HYR domain-containing protein, partial [Candidatus Cloacimonetes bacterium]|nr:HYR domain-containing protein [Candidatus Cloacimonadota bacterium]